MAVSLTLLLRARSEEEAYKQTVECITGPISKLISTKGMPAVYEALDDHGKEIFKKVRGDVTLLAWRCTSRVATLLRESPSRQDSQLCSNTALLALLRTACGSWFGVKLAVLQCRGSLLPGIRGFFRTRDGHLP